MSARSVIVMSHLNGLYEIRIMQVSRFLRWSYLVVDCDGCGLISTRYQRADHASRVARTHVRLHEDAIKWRLAQAGADEWSIHD